jgi:hypothetical protein
MKLKLLLFLIILPLFSSATTASYVHASITPIAVNEKGEILCKTRYGINRMGGGYLYDFLKFGFCVLTEDSIHYFKGKKLVNNFEQSDFEADVEFWDAIFDSKTSINQLETIVSDVLNDSFVFTEVNAEKYKVDSTMNHDVFQANYGFNLNETRQKSLFNGMSNKNTNNGKVHVLYNFGGAILLENNRGYEEPDYYDPNKIGCEFSYSYTSMETYGFDIDAVTGVLFKRE